MKRVASRVGRRLGGTIRNAAWWLAAAPACAAAVVRNAVGRRHYRELSEARLRATRTSDTVFIFGSGSSLNEITPSEWNAIAAANTISFRDFPRQSFVRADYHLTGEVDDLDEYAARLRENPRYAETVFVVQAGWKAYMGNNLIGRRLLRDRASVFRYRRVARGRYAPPSRSFEEGLVHGFGSLIGVVNFAYLMGWQDIVIAGVDLYDKRYFWLPPDTARTYEKAGMKIDSQFINSARIVGMLGQWRQIFASEGVRLTVYNSRSLLTAALPVYPPVSA